MTGAMLHGGGVGVIMLFNLITLPVEFDASNRAKRSAGRDGPCGHAGTDGCSRRRCSMPRRGRYVAAFITSLAYLIWHLLPLLMGRREE